MEEEKRWTVYHLGCFEADGLTLVRDKRNAPLTYKGITVNICQRLRKENQITVGGPKNCRIRGGSLVSEGKRVWKPFYIIPNLLGEFARQLEISIKPDYTSIRNKVLKEEKSDAIHKRLDQSLDGRGEALLTSIKNTFASLHMQRCTPEATPTASLSLVIQWCQPQFRPVNSSDLLPSCVVEQILTRDEKKLLFQVSDKSRPWPLPPWD